MFVWSTLRAIIFFERGLKNTGGHEFLERKIGGHKIFDGQNVGSLRMTTDSAFILFKKSDFKIVQYNFSLLVGKVYRWWPGGGGALPYIGGYQVPVNRPPFYADPTPNDPFFDSVHTQWPPFFHFFIKFYIAILCALTYIHTYIYNAPFHLDQSAKVEKQSKI